MLTAGIDSGNFAGKMITSLGAFQWRSCLGEYRPFQMEKSLNVDDMVWEYNGKRGFIGKLALKESRYIRETFGDTKAHEDALIRILSGIHRFTNDTEYNLIVGQPIKKHKADKQKIITMLQGKHTFTLNGITKTFFVHRVNVAPEGAGAFWSYRGNEEKVHIIDVGSGTVNMATVFNGEFIDRDSDTLGFGVGSNSSNDLNGIAEAIISRSRDFWRRDEAVRICGGSADELKNLLASYFTNIQVIHPMIKEGNSFKVVHPTFANAAGFYELGRELYG